MIDGYRYALQLHFDEASERHIGSMIDELRSLDLVNESFIKSNYRPHLSFVVFREMDPVFAQRLVDVVAEEFKVFQLQFTHLQTFSAKVEALCLGINVTDELKAIHGRVHQLLEGRPEKCWEYYLPDAWTPHCGLLIDDDKSNIDAGAAHLEGRDLPCVTAETICMTGFRDSIIRTLASGDAP